MVLDELEVRYGLTSLGMSLSSAGSTLAGRQSLSSFASLGGSSSLMSFAVDQVVVVFMTRSRSGLR